MHPQNDPDTLGPMLVEPRPLPPATLHERSTPKRWLLALGKTPRWASGRASWAVSAGCSAAALHLLSAVVRSGDLRVLYEIGKVNLSMLLLYSIAALVITFAFYIPLWISANMYFALFARPSRASAVLWCACFHSAAHLAIGYLFNGSLVPAAYNLHVPLIIGAAWGAWLPGTVDDLNEARR